MKKGIGNYDVYTEENFFKKKGIAPHQWVDMKGLMGDSADNYPGVYGIGEKTAVKLLREYGTVEHMLRNWNQLPKGVQTKSNNHMEMLKLSMRLAEIQCHAPVKCSLEKAVWMFNEEQVHRKLSESEVEHLTRLIV